MGFFFFGRVELAFGEVGVGVQGSREGSEGGLDLAQQGWRQLCTGWRREIAFDGGGLFECGVVERVHGDECVRL